MPKPITLLATALVAAALVPATATADEPDTNEPSTDDPNVCRVTYRLSSHHTPDGYDHYVELDSKCAHPVACTVINEEGAEIAVELAPRTSKLVTVDVAEDRSAFDAQARCEPAS